MTALDHTDPGQPPEEGRGGGFSGVGPPPTALVFAIPGLLAVAVAVSFSFNAGSQFQSTVVSVALGVSLTGAMFGIWGVYRILSVSGGDERREFLAMLLADALDRERTFVSA